MRASVYIETTIPSYLTAWPSRDLVRAAHQQITQEWWNQRTRFELFTSELVVYECQAGDTTAAAERMKALDGIPLLQQSATAAKLAQSLVLNVPLPVKAATDALHIAIATVHSMRFLLTWNCTHIANAVLRSKIESVCRQAGYEPPLVCTPEELLP